MADINGGALSFEVLINTGQLAEGLDEVKRRVADSTAAIEKGGAAGDAAFARVDATMEKLASDIVHMENVTDASIAKLTAKSNELGRQMSESFSLGTKAGDELYRQLAAEKAAVDKTIRQAKQHKHEIQSVSNELDKEAEAVSKAKAKTEEHEQATVKLRTALMNAKNSLAEMEQAGLRGTEQYKKMQEEVARLTKAMKSVNTQGKRMGQSFAGLQGVMSAISGVSGAFTMAQGAASLLGEKNEDLQKSMLKVQSLMSITMGLQQVCNTLNQNSAFRLVVVTKAQALYASANDRTSAALIRLGISTKAADAAAKALTATLTLGLTAAITIALSAISKMMSATKKSKEEAQDFNKSVADSAVKPLDNIRTLSKQWSKLGDDMNSKSKFIKDHAKDFTDLGVQVSSVEDAENLLIANKDAFIAAQMAKAKAIAAQSIATDKAKQLLEKEMEIEKEPLTKTVFQSTQYGSSYSYEVENGKRKKLEAERDKLQNELDGIYEKMDAANDQYASILKQAGISTEKTEEEEKKQTTTYLQQLQERKKAYTEYSKWANSTDEIARNAASSQFADILKDGSTYLEYLKSTRDNLLQQIGTGSATAEQASRLADLNSEITSETTTTLISEFQKALESEISGADTILDVLDIIKRKREEVGNDTGDLATKENELLDKAQEDADKDVTAQTDALIDQYADYINKKIEFEAEYCNKVALLSRKLAQASSEDEKRIVEQAMAELAAEREKYAKQTGNKTYDTMLEQYRTFSQKRADIEKEYDDKIAVASQNGNQQMMDELQKAKAKALSSAALDELQNSDVWSKLFDDMDNLTTKEIATLIARVKKQKLTFSADLDPEAVNVIMTKLKTATDTIRERNPWKAMGIALKNYKESQKKENAAEIFKSIASATSQVSGIFDSVTDGLQKMGVATDDVTGDLLGDISEMMNGVGTLATGIATGNPLQIVQGTISTITSALEVFNIHDRKADYSIQRHQKQLDDLESAYQDLSRAVDKALGSDYYSESTELIRNLKEQQKEVDAMRAEEAGKKKADEDTLDELSDKSKSLGQEVEDTIDEMREKLLGTDVASIAQQLGDAIFDAFSDGEDAAEAWGNKVNDIVKGIMKNLIIQNVLTKPLQTIVDKYTSQWVDGTGQFKGWDVVYGSIENLAEDLNASGQSAIDAVKMITDRMPDLFGGDEALTSMSGAIKTASQESIDLLAGQTNAIRVQQAETAEVIRQQLVLMTSINGYTAKIQRTLDNINSKINGTTEADQLRAKGIDLNSL